MSCNLQSAIAGLIKDPRLVCPFCTLFDVKVLKVGSYEIEWCESGQAGNGAAINIYFYVP